MGYIKGRRGEEEKKVSLTAALKIKLTSRKKSFGPVHKKWKY